MTTEPHDPARSDDGPPNFLRDMVQERLAQRPDAPLVTRFPPEPNGYLHIGHAKSIVLNFGLAALAPQGRCNLRFDDTNPATEETEYVESIQRDVQWLGFQWSGPVRYASDYFEQLYQWALQLIRDGKAYVDSQSLEELRQGRGSFHAEGRPSPYRDRSVEENLDLFQRMRAGEFEDGQHVLRAKIDMTSKDVKLRDPLMYRIRKAHHHRTGDAWPIYPMYDWAHGQSDAIEGVTHSICTLEFQNHRPLYDWFLDAIGIPEPRTHQTEFARLNLSYTVLSKRKLQRLVRESHVDGWDDPRMPTIAGLRRRGVPAAAIRAFCERIGVARRDGVVDVSLLEHHIREELNATARRVMGVLRPLKVVLENLPEDFQVTIDAPYHPEDPSFGARPLQISREIYIERDDFLEDPPKKFFRLAPGQEVRLRYAALIRCVGVIKDSSGEITELRCTWDPETFRKSPPDGRKVKGTIHWADAATAESADINLYDRLFAVEDPNALDDFVAAISPSSVERLRGCKLEPSLAALQPGDSVQLERLGYFCADQGSAPGALRLNRTITLKDTWAKIAARQP